MKYIVDVAGERVIVDLDGTHAEVDGERLAVSLVTIEGTPVRLVRIGEQVHRLMARRGGGRGLWTLDLDGQRMEVEALDERLRAIRDLTAAAAEASGPAPLKAPMPGLEVRVSVSVGDTGSAGQGLVVVEAMKMETSIAADRDGEITQLYVHSGSQVEAGDLLLVLK